MRLYYCVVVLSAVVAASTPGQGLKLSRVCAMGICFPECEDGTHAYTTGCSRLVPEPTCDVPDPVQSNIRICDFFACYCNKGTVRDTKTRKCVKLKDCK